MTSRNEQPVTTVGGRLKKGMFSSEYGTLSIESGRLEFRAEDGSGDRTIALAEIAGIESKGKGLVLRLQSGEEVEFIVGGLMTSFTEIGSPGGRFSYRDAFRLALDEALKS